MCVLLGGCGHMWLCSAGLFRCVYCLEDVATCCCVALGCLDVCTAWRVCPDGRTHHVTGHYTPIHNILSTCPQLSISQKALETLPENGNVMPKHVGATIDN